MAARWTDRADGDLGHAGRYVTAVDEAVASRRSAVTDRNWCWIRQVHGTSVAIVSEGWQPGEVADAAVTTRDDVALTVLTADCAPVALASETGVLAAVHAGWRGLEGGVIEAALDAMRRLGATRIAAALGPCIGAECYEFGADDLERLVARLGPTVSSTTATGSAALDLRAGVIATLERAGVDAIDTDHWVCTACSPDHYSFRARGEMQRQALVMWRQ